MELAKWRAVRRCTLHQVLVGKEEVARMTGLEPATSGVTGRRSIQLSYIRVTATSPRGASDMTLPESCQRPISRSCGQTGAASSFLRKGREGGQILRVIISRNVAAIEDM